MKLLIESATPSKSGKTFNVKVGDKYYLAKKDSNIQSAIGKTIEAETSESDYNGATLLWINEWAIVPNGATVQQANGDIMKFMPFVSNTVANAIRGGYCQEPTSISAWAKGAYEAAVALESIAEFRDEL